MKEMEDEGLRDVLMPGNRRVDERVQIEAFFFSVLDPSNLPCYSSAVTHGRGRKHGFA
jgi:hypothetical protein